MYRITVLLIFLLACEMEPLIEPSKSENIEFRAEENVAYYAHNANSALAKVTVVYSPPANADEVRIDLLHYYTFAGSASTCCNIFYFDDSEFPSNDKFVIKDEVCVRFSQHPGYCGSGLAMWTVWEDDNQDGSASILLVQYRVGSTWYNGPSITADSSMSE